MGLIVKKINSQDKLEELKKDWENVHLSDPNANMYNSWDWFRGWTEYTSADWFVVVVKDDKSKKHIAFLPLCYQNRKVGGITLNRRIHFGGYNYSYYSAFLCSPEVEDKAIESISHFIRDSLNWDYFAMRWIRDFRINRFISYFPDHKFEVKLVDSQPSLVINLPGDIDSFFKNNMGRSTRRKTRQNISYVKNNDNYRITISNSNTIKRDIDILCEMWNNRWHKDHEIEWYSQIMYYYFKKNLLRLSVLWDGDIPVAAESSMLDPANKIYNAYLTTYDPAYSNMSPGIVLLLESIQYAIEHDYKYYDLTIGEDYYKLSFKPQKIATKNLYITRKGVKSKLFKLIKQSR